MCYTGTRARAGASATNVRVPRDPEGARVHPRRAAAGGGARARRTRAQMRQRPEREPRSKLSLLSTLVVAPSMWSPSILIHTYYYVLSPLR
jgi:hypothetical protein